MAEIRPIRPIVKAEYRDGPGVIPPVPRVSQATMIYADDMAEMTYLMKRDGGRLFLPRDGLSARDMVIPIYTEMLNRFGGEYACISPDWAIRFDYAPDISRPIDAYRMTYYLVARMGHFKYGPDLVWLCGCELREDGFHVIAQDYEIVIKVRYDDVQRAIARREEEAETNSQRDYRPLP